MPCRACLLPRRPPCDCDCAAAGAATCTCTSPAARSTASTAASAPGSAPQACSNDTNEARALKLLLSLLLQLVPPIPSTPPRVLPLSLARCAAVAPIPRCTLPSLDPTTEPPSAPRGKPWCTAVPENALGLAAASAAGLVRPLGVLAAGPGHDDATEATMEAAEGRCPVAGGVGGSPCCCCWVCVTRGPRSSEVVREVAGEAAKAAAGEPTVRDTPAEAAARAHMSAAARKFVAAAVAVAEGHWPGGVGGRPAPEQRCGCTACGPRSNDTVREVAGEAAETGERPQGGDCGPLQLTAAAAAAAVTVVAAASASASTAARTTSGLGPQ